MVPRHSHEGNRRRPIVPFAAFPAADRHYCAIIGSVEVELSLGAYIPKVTRFARSGLESRTEPASIPESAVPSRKPSPFEFHKAASESSQVLLTSGIRRDLALPVICADTG